jgi:transcriptional regulator with XRE-family HTH domain
MDIGTVIKKTRREKDMTQEQLAEYLNVSVSAVSQWESEKTLPDISLVSVLCNLLGITSDKLLGIDIEKKKEEMFRCNFCRKKDSSRYNLTLLEIKTKE